MFQLATSLRHLPRFLAPALITAMVSLWPVALPAAEANTWDFGLIGDLPYTREAEEWDFPNLIEDLNRARLKLVIHDGDIKSGSSPCSDAVFNRRLAQFQTIQHPLFYIFGDNEWCDCKREGAGSMDPLERLAKLRSLFCVGNSSLGATTLSLERQSEIHSNRFSEFRENIRWSHQGVLFSGFNLPGGGNNYGEPDYALRNEANLKWLTDSFEQAKRLQSLGLVLVIQANPQFEIARTNAIRRGFNPFLDLLQRQTADYARPVLLVHGDSHYFRVDKPLIHPEKKRRMEHFTRVETFGHPDAHWVRVTVNPSDLQLFQIRPEIVEKNRAGR